MIYHDKNCITTGQREQVNNFLVNISNMQNAVLTIFEHFYFGILRGG